jgi:hypothetical protein
MDVVSIAYVSEVHTASILMLNILILKMKAACTSETLPTLPKSTWCKGPRAESTSSFWTLPNCVTERSSTGEELVQL